MPSPDPRLLLDKRVERFRDAARLGELDGLCATRLRRVVGLPLVLLPTGLRLVVDITALSNDVRFSSIQNGVRCGCACSSAVSLIHTSTPPPMFIAKNSTPKAVPTAESHGCFPYSPYDATTP